MIGEKSWSAFGVFEVLALERSSVADIAKLEMGKATFEIVLNLVLNKSSHTIRSHQCVLVVRAEQLLPGLHARWGGPWIWMPLPAATAAQGIAIRRALRKSTSAHVCLGDSGHMPRERERKRERERERERERGGVFKNTGSELVAA